MLAPVHPGERSRGAGGEKDGDLVVLQGAELLRSDEPAKPAVLAVGDAGAVETLCLRHGRDDLLSVPDPLGDVLHGGEVFCAGVDLEGALAPEDVRLGKVPIFAHESLVHEFATAMGITAELEAIRSAHMFGSYLSGDDFQDMNAGIGPPFVGGPSLGGHDKVLAEAHRAFTSGDPQFTAGLATFLVRIHKNDWDARYLKAAAYRKLGYAQINATWRNWYLTSATDLEGTFPVQAYMTRVHAGLGSAEAMARFPPLRQVENLPSRLKAEDVVDVRMTVGFRYTDAKEDYTVEIRRGVAEVRVKVTDNPMVVLDGDAIAIASPIANATAVDVAVKTGQIKLTGSVADADRFFGYFERPCAEMPQVTVR